MTSKECRKCRQELELTEFTRSNIGKYGVNSTCKVCQRGKVVNDSPKQKKSVKRKNTGEKELFKEIALERSIEGCCTCVGCGKLIPLGYLSPANFDHEIPKSRGEEYRLDKDNIKVKCFACHFKKTTGLNLKTEYNN